MDDDVRLGLVNVGADLINITLPWPPSVNRIWRCVAGRAPDIEAQGSAQAKALLGTRFAQLDRHGLDAGADGGRDGGVLFGHDVFCFSSPV